MFTDLTGSRPEDGETPTVFVVDGDPAARESLASLIRSAGWRPRTAASAEEFLPVPCIAGASCLVTELELPGMSGLELQRLMRDRSDMPIVFLSGSADILSIVRAMKAGAVELLTKPLTAGVLLAAIRDAIERSRSAVNYLSHIRMLRARYASLSAREREVLNLVAAGHMNKQVSSDLGITEFTVKVHRGRAMRKMQARSFAELVTMVASLRRASAAMATRLPARSDPPTGTATFMRSTRLDTFDLTPARTWTYGTAVTDTGFQPTSF